MSHAITNVTYDENAITMPTGDEYRRNHTARNLLNAAAQAAGVTLQERYPLSTREVFAVLKLMGYGCNFNKLNHCLSLGAFPFCARSFPGFLRVFFMLPAPVQLSRSWIAAPTAIRSDRLGGLAHASL
jgi:hypothetical protein